MEFKNLPLSNEVKKALDSIGFIEATPIQAEAIPQVLDNKDLIGQAQTGTGKTFSFGLPLIDKLKDETDKFLGLIICPTRELAIQVDNELNKVIAHVRGIKTTVVYGGQDIQKQIRSLKKGPQIIIGTPGRIMDHLRRKTLNFKNLKTIILDEADEMLKMGFEEDINTILSSANDNHQTLLFSATMPNNIKKIAQKYLTDPHHIKIKASELTVSRIKQCRYTINEKNKFNLLIRLLDYYNFRSSVIFCNTKRGVDELAQKLEKLSFRSDGLHGDLSQNQRDRVMKSFRNKNINILVATDVAARGIDVKEVDVVFNYDLPQEEEFYVHRIGRTGRAGREGMSISFADRSRSRRIENIERYAKTKIEELQIPTVEEVREKTLQNQLVNVINNIKDEDTNLIHKLLTEKGYTDTQIINGLLNTFSFGGRNYPEIVLNTRNNREQPRRRNRNSRDGESRNSDRGSRNSERGSRRTKIPKDKGFISINIGKKESLRPQTLLSYFKQKTDVKSLFIGDIKIRTRKTVFEVDKRDENKILSILNKSVYKGNQLTANKENNLD